MSRTLQLKSEILSNFHKASVDMLVANMANDRAANEELTQKNAELTKEVEALKKEVAELKK